MTRRTYVFRNGEMVEKKQPRRKKNIEFSVAPDIGFASYQLPKNWQHHQDAGGEFTDRGQPIFSSRKQIEEAMARARGEAGTLIEYNEL